MFKRVAFIGMGLIGGSLAKVLREKSLCDVLVGNSRSQKTMQAALELGLVDEIYEDPADAVKGCDLVVLAMPVSFTEQALKLIAPALSDEAIVTDVGSVKGSVQQAAENVLQKKAKNFVAAHPIAGSEQSGVFSGRSDLFVNHKVILTPIESTQGTAVKKITSMWREAGADVIQMNIEEHDRVLAATSHLPHLLAYTLVDSLASSSDGENIFRYAAGGFRDFTRIASSDPKMWRDIFLENKKETLNAVKQYTETLTELSKAIESEDGDFLMGTFTRAKSARDHFVAMLNQQTYTESVSELMHSQKNITFVVRPSSSVSGTAHVAGDKSISHRSVMLASLSEGVSKITGFLEGEDSLATLQAFRDMGVVIEGPDDGQLIVHGVGLNGLKKPPGPLYLGNSGTSMRLLMGLLSGQSFNTELRGDASLSKRPMERVARPLREMGAVIETEGGSAPVKITGQSRLSGINYSMEVVSAQVKSAILLAGLYSDEDVKVKELDITRDHSERMLRGFGCDLQSEGLNINFPGGEKVLKAQDIEVPGDISSAAFFIVAASIAEGSDVTLRHVGLNPTRTGLIDILQAMGADINFSNEKVVGGEPVADIRVKYAALKGIVIPEEKVSLAIDEFPIIFIAAACAEGSTELSNAEELRVKETDRIAVMAEGLSALGVENEVKPDGILIKGRGSFDGGDVNSGGDHRIAMAFSVASLRAKGDIVISDCANVATSFPNFVSLANELGLQLAVQGE
jgi:3-phosphoshikimate 1-carboxyvinyltransferase